MTEVLLERHVLLDPVEGHMAGSLDHHLHIVTPRHVGQVSQDPELADLRGVVRVGDGSGSEPIAE